MPNGFNTGSGQPPNTATTMQVPHPTIPSVPAPSPASVPPSFPLTPNLQGIVGGGMFPFGMPGAFQNSAQSSHFNLTWNYGYNLARYQILNTPPVINNQSNNSVSNCVSNGTGISSHENITFPMQKKECVESDSHTVERKAGNVSNGQLNEELIALKVSSLLTDSMLLKDAISETLQNNNASVNKSNSDASFSNGPKGSVSVVDDIFEATSQNPASSTLQSSVADTCVSNDFNDTSMTNATDNSHVDPSVR